MSDQVEAATRLYDAMAARDVAALLAEARRPHGAVDR
jgi:hypothetical protein